MPLFLRGILESAMRSLAPIGTGPEGTRRLQDHWSPPARQVFRTPIARTLRQGSIPQGFLSWHSPRSTPTKPLEGVGPGAIRAPGLSRPISYPPVQREKGERLDVVPAGVEPRLPNKLRLSSSRRLSRPAAGPHRWQPLQMEHASFGEPIFGLIRIGGRCQESKHGLCSHLRC